MPRPHEPADATATQNVLTIAALRTGVIVKAEPHVPVTTVAANLVHSSTAATMNVYAHRIPSAEVAAARIVQRALEGAS